MDAGLGFVGYLGLLTRRLQPYGVSPIAMTDHNTERLSGCQVVRFSAR